MPTLTSSAHVPVALARRTLTPFGLWVFGAAASAPLVVLAGGIPATYATTRVVALPLTFLLVAGAVALLAVGYTAMARQVGHPAAYYGIAAHGMGRGAGVAAGLVALVAYNAIQTSLYGLFGATVAATLGGAWWVWAGIALTVVGVLGVRAIVLSTRVLVAVLAASLLVVAVFVLAAVGRPAGGELSWAGFDASGLAVGGIGGAVAFCVAAFMGVDAPGSLVEETTDRRSVGRATISAVVVLGGVYTLTAWAMSVAVGPAAVADVAADPAVGLPFSVLARVGGGWVPLAEVMLVLAIVTSMLAFHSVVARYVFAMAREGVLPAGLAHAGTGTRVSAPRGGSLAQTTVAAVVVGAFALGGADPVAAMFTWLSTLGAMGLLCLLLAASAAAMTAPAAVRGRRPGLWEWRLAPALGVFGGSAVLAAMIGNVGSLLGAAPGSPYPYLLPAIIVAAAVTGGLWAGHLRSTRPDVYAGIGRGTPTTHAVPDTINVSI
ncbi:amino acid permease [Micromonospora craterilacus]|uniref:Amino acid permease n=1 Tax=Micromonospora craterilacus TaxID=1655439 RepID=A0A2W2F2M5_9ACTN|nr:APC family permease [Micromonospora craterilacus]PZG19188.1 amino acid permease [Micromonospora craterilacus]